MPAFRVKDAPRDLVELPGRGVALSLIDFGGDGPLAVLSHANGFCASVHAPIAVRLRERFHVVAFDSRGHGGSTMPTPPASWEWREFALDWLALAEALRKRTGAARVELGVGHSFGGSALLSAAARRPDLFGGIALLDPVLVTAAGERAAPSPEGGSKSLAAAARRRAAVFPSREAIRSSWARRGVFSDWDPDVLAAYLRDGFRERSDGNVELCCPPEVEAAIFEAAPRFDLSEEIPALEVPTLWLHAARGSFPLPPVEWVRGGAGCVEVVSLDGGHLMPMVSPREIADRVLAWTATRSAATARRAP